VFNSSTGINSVLYSLHFNKEKPAKKHKKIVKTMLLSSGERGDITWTLYQTPPVPPHSLPLHLHSLSHYPSEKTERSNTSADAIHLC